VRVLLSRTHLFPVGLFPFFFFFVLPLEASFLTLFLSLSLSLLSLLNQLQLASADIKSRFGRDAVLISAGRQMLYFRHWNNRTIMARVPGRSDEVPIPFGINFHLEFEVL
jgi:hypothetical protein